MEGRDALVRALSGAVEAALEPERWNAVCEDIASSSNATAFMIFEFDIETRSAPVFHGSALMHTLGRPFVDELMSGASIPEELENYHRLVRTAPGVMVSENEVYGVSDDADLPRNPFRDRVFAQTGARSRLAARLNDIGPWIDAAALHMPCYGKDVPGPLRAEVEILLPVIGKAIETGRIVRALTRQWTSLLDLFDRLDFGAAFCDETGKAVLANRCLRDIARQADALTLDGSSRLDAAVTDERGVIGRLATRALAADALPGDLIAALPRRSGGRPLIVKAAPTPSDSIGWRGAPMLSLLLFLDPDVTRTVSTDGLAAFGLLSQAELEVCRHLVEGLTTTDIAERRDTSVETTRSQIKAASAKLACSSRLDLVRLALATQSPLREGSTGSRSATDPG